MQRINDIREYLAKFARENCVPCRTGGNAELCAELRKTRKCIYQTRIGMVDTFDGRYQFEHGRGSRQSPSHYILKLTWRQKIIRILTFGKV